MRQLDATWQADVLAGEPLLPGDLVCYLNARGDPCLHRVLRVHPDRLVVRGDTARPEPNVPKTAVIGRVVALHRGALTIPLPRNGRLATVQRQIGLLWSTIAPVLQATWRARPNWRRNV